MRTTIEYLRQMVIRMNIMQNTTTLTLYKDACGYALNRIVNPGNGQAHIQNSYGMTATETAWLLKGMDEVLSHPERYGLQFVKDGEQK